MFGTQARGPHQVDLWTTPSHQVDLWAARDPHQVDLWAAQSHTSGPLGRFDEAIHIASTKATLKETMVPSSMARQSALEFIEEKPRCSKVRQVWGHIATLELVEIPRVLARVLQCEPGGCAPSAFRPPGADNKTAVLLQKRSRSGRMIGAPPRPLAAPRFVQSRGVNLALALACTAHSPHEGRTAYA